MSLQPLLLPPPLLYSLCSCLLARQWLKGRALNIIAQLSAQPTSFTISSVSAHTIHYDQHFAQLQRCFVIITGYWNMCRNAHLNLDVKVCNVRTEECV
jgi:hypothetical protein